MKAKVLREMSVEELQKQYKDNLDALYKLRFQKSLGQMENKKKIYNLKKDIARILTILKEKGYAVK
ncbi:MAG: 50S ribosomal protein L29 [Thermoanaerobaculia bacterium]